MLRPRKAVLSILVLAVGSSAVGAEFKPGEVIVKFKEGGLRARSEMNMLYDSVGVKDIHRYSGLMKGYEHLVLGEEVDVEKAVAILRSNKAIAYAQPNYILRALPVADTVESPSGVKPFMPCIIPGIPFPPGCDDSDDGSNPGNPDDGEGGSPQAGRPELKEPPAELNPPVADPDLSKTYGLDKIKAKEAWAIHRGDRSFVVADIDTGIDYNHEDLGLNLWRNPNPSDKKDIVGYDFVHNDGLPFDDNQHGSHTAGTIGAVGGNGKGISGVIQKVSLMSIKFLSGRGEGTTADAIRAIDYAIQHGARVLSNSWGGPGDSDNPALKDAVERARAKDVLFIAAAGNDGADNDTTPSYPAAFDNDNMISVAATDENDGMAYFSNYGKKTTHLGAPGVGVFSTTPKNKYAKLSGTSMACPHVAGAAALLWSKHPNWNYKKVKDVLLRSVDKVASLEGKTITGGRLNILNALNYKGEGEGAEE